MMPFLWHKPSSCCAYLARLACCGALTFIGASLLAQGVAEPMSPEVADRGPVWTSVNRGSLRAIVQAAQDIRLSARAAGVIQRYAAEEGQSLRKDAPILILDDNQEKAELAQAEAVLRASQAEVSHAEGEFERAKPLSEERIFSDKQFAEAKYALEVARSRLAQAEAAVALAKVRLADRTIISPFDGIFLKKSKSIGEAIERFEPVARLVDLSYLEIVVYCDASLFGSFNRDRAVSVQVSKSDDSPSVVVQGTVSYVDPIIDPASGTFRVRVRLPASGSTAPGYTAVLLPPTGIAKVP
jgi:RND family efflux transporter MFP subunit